MTNSPIAAVLLAACLLFAGCARQHGGGSATASTDYVLVTLKRGDRASTYSDAERTSIQAAHLANIRRLANERKLVVAGPYGKVNHDATARGIFIFDVPSLEEAKALTATDPAVQAGVLMLEPARLATAADLRGALEAGLARDAADKAAGIERPISEQIRPWVMLQADDGDRAEALLRATLPPRSIVIAARVDAHRGFFIIDAPNASTVEGWLGESAATLGHLTVDEWWADKSLSRAAAD